jgi:[acyl-carrier-protein] S-malonyltransferase
LSTALVFPGQGSQRESMATPWAETAGFERWAEADELLGWDVSSLGTRADAERLRKPAACQVALFVHQTVVLETWLAAGGAQPAAVAGHSLGEYNALVAAGVLGFADALALVDARARATERAAEASPGTMVACLGYPVETVTAACAETGASLANDNAPGQMVAAGSAASLEALQARLAETGGPRGRVVAMEVGAAYHSQHMASAADELAPVLRDAPFGHGECPLVANVDAAAHRSSSDWAELLRQQLTAPVRWRESVHTLAGLGIGEVVELAAAPVLTGLVKRTDPSLARRTVTEPGEPA